MVDIGYEAIRLLRAAQNAAMKGDQWRVGRYAFEEMRRFFSEPFSVTLRTGPVDMTFMGLQMVVDSDLDNRQISLRAGSNTVGSFTV